MCYVDVHENVYLNCYDFVSSGCDRPLPDGSKTDVLNYFCNYLNLIDILLQMFETNYVFHCNAHQNK